MVKKWKHSIFRNIKVYERYGKCYLYINHNNTVHRKATNIIFSDKNKALALKELEKEYERISSNKKVEIQKDNVQISSAIQQFCRLQKDRCSKHTLQHYINAFRYYIPHDMNCNDYTKIRDMVIEQIQVRKHSESTQNKALSFVRKLFDFSIEQGYCTKNPITKSLIPPKRTRKQTSIFSSSEIDSICTSILDVKKVLRSRDILQEKELLVLYVRFLQHSGCRCEEALKVTFEDITSETIRIDGKRVYFNTPKVRLLPFALLPELCETLSAIREHFTKYNKEQTGKLFSWISTETPRYYFREAQKALNIYEPQKRSFHEIRKTFVFRLQMQGLPDRVRNYILGHTKDIEQKNYTKEYEVSEIVQLAQLTLRSFQ